MSVGGSLFVLYDNTVWICNWCKM